MLFDLFADAVTWSLETPRPLYSTLVVKSGSLFFSIAKK
jgi:hypothetical protein